MDNKLIHKGNLIELHHERVELSGGDHTFFDIVKHPGGAVIAAIDSKANICLLKQWRHAVNQFIWELPAGCLEPNESPLSTAKRELQEEAAVVADTWQSLGQLVPSPGFSNEILHLYQAQDLRAGKQNLDDAEQLEVHWVPLDTAREMAINGEINDAKTLAVLVRLKL